MGKTKLFLLAVISMGLVSGCLTNAATTHDGYLPLQQQRAVNFQMAAVALDEGVRAYCQKRSVESLTGLKLQWKTAFMSWMSLQGQEQGPEQAMTLAWQIQFYPDKKNTTGRKLSHLMKGKQELSPAYMATQSVAAQGLGALEWLLFDENADRRTDRFCQLGEAVSGHLAATSGLLTEAWNEDPWAGAPEKVRKDAYFRALANQFDFVMKKLARPLGKPGSPKPYQLEAWRSRSSLESLKASSVALQALYFANGGGLDAELRERGKTELADRLGKHFNLLVEAFPVRGTAWGMLHTESGYRKLLGIYNELEYIRIALSDEAAPVLGIVEGFNATDGD
ncbi:imelysin family protein [Parasalinivibrio latis]|uniref:imelysin family protein n=1 Tax=Parasalinivibrio latis TaxID=2952610 RepID=UPI0030E1AA9F